MTGFADVSAVIVTRGDVPLDEILASLPYGETVVYDNSVEVDLKVYGRHHAARRFAKSDVVYLQDDDVLVPFETHEALLAAHLQTPEVMVAVDAHGANYGGYEDLCWTGAGSILPKSLIRETWRRWWRVHWDMTEEFLYEADAVFGILCPHRMLRLPYINLYPNHGDRLCDQPWQADAKRRYAGMARAIRDADQD